MKLFKRKEKRNYLKEDLKGPFKHRFTFVAETEPYFAGYVVQIPDKVKNVKKAFYIACEIYVKKNEDKEKKKVAVFYGDQEAPDVADVLYEAFHSFDKIKRK